MVDVNLEAISLYISPDLGLVTLNPNLTPDGIISPDVQPPPSVMASPAMVPSPNYRWYYKDIRFLQLGYVMTRNASAYEAGEIAILSSQPYVEVDENVTMALPALSTTWTTTHVLGGSVGCTLSIAEDSLSDDFNPKFGVSFQITSASPAVYPTLRVWVKKLLVVDKGEG